MAKQWSNSHAVAMSITPDMDTNHEPSDLQFYALPQRQHDLSPAPASFSILFYTIKVISAYFDELHLVQKRYLRQNATMQDDTTVDFMNEIKVAAKSPA